VSGCRIFSSIPGKHFNDPVTVGRGIEVDSKCGEIKRNEPVATMRVPRTDAPW